MKCNADITRNRCWTRRHRFWMGFTGSVRTALADNFRANKLQTLYFGAPCHQRSSTIVFDWTGNFCRRHPWSCNTTLGSETGFICSANKTGLFRTSVFCCWTEGMEQIACWHQTHNRHETFLKEAENIFVYSCLSWISSIAFSDFDFDIIQCTLDNFVVKLATGLCVSGTQKWLIINK